MIKRYIHKWERDTKIVDTKEIKIIKVKPKTSDLRNLIMKWRTYCLIFYRTQVTLLTSMLGSLFKKRNACDGSLISLHS